MTDEERMDYEALTAPFEWDEVKYRVGATTNDKKRGMVLFYIDARAVARRLDEVAGPGHWSDDIEIIDKEHVLCRLTVNGVSHADIGDANEGGFADPLKSAASDALKRAAVKFGIGRYLYEHKDQWVSLDNGKVAENAIKTVRATYEALAGIKAQPAASNGSAPAQGDSAPPAGPGLASERQVAKIEELLNAIAKIDAMREGSIAQGLAKRPTLAYAVERGRVEWARLRFDDAQRLIEYLVREEEAVKKQHATSAGLPA